MNFDFLKQFTRKSNPEQVRLQAAENHDVEDLAQLVRMAQGASGITIADRMPDDSLSALQAAVIATESGPMNPEMAARMAWVNHDLG